ncbi:unnamed protein product [Candida verbasci]|uniref:Uncharacterized protein n=1 Tax=Candida verbasci TaxID=1227364 RepID=A0A9W4TW30_9ASCO|nr:unnamed protein product [Candida verbasci]
MNSIIKLKKRHLKQNNQDDYYEVIKPNLIHSSNIPYKIISIFQNKKKLLNNIYITVQIELNTLLSRSSIKLSTLLKRNLISVHQSNKSYLSSIIRNEKSNSINLNTLDDNFIVTIKLQFDLSISEKVIIRFKQDENYNLFHEFILIIESYIRNIVLKELEDSEDQKKSFSDISDSTLECSEEEDIMMPFVEPLKSNDTLSDEFKRRYSDISDEEKFLSDKFLDIENLRHNEEIITPKTSAITNFHSCLDDLIEVECEMENEGLISPEKKRNKLPSSSPLKFDEDDYDFTKLTRSNSFQSPTKVRKSISRMTSNHSISMVNSDEKFGLEYAFNSSSDVPSYIKDDKKFKFIKVGKVQKFVNLFEEKKENDSNSNSQFTSRKTSRVGSRIPSRSTSPTI